MMASKILALEREKAKLIELENHKLRQELEIEMQQMTSLIV